MSQWPSEDLHGSRCFYEHGKGLHVSSGSSSDIKRTRVVKWLPWLEGHSSALSLQMPWKRWRRQEVSNAVKKSTDLLAERVVVVVVAVVGIVGKLSIRGYTHRCMHVSIHHLKVIKMPLLCMSLFFQADLRTWFECWSKSRLEQTGSSSGVRQSYEAPRKRAKHWSSLHRTRWIWINKGIKWIKEGYPKEVEHLELVQY